jgi:hypothetical protein
LTVQHYGDKLVSFDLERLNSNIIDPIKLIFDKMVYGYTWDEIIKNEIYRQRDKSNTNEIGYFHQNIFQYIKGCSVPKSGWDVVFKSPKNIVLSENKPEKVKTIFVEMKNKHNTMNSSSGSKTYIRMLNQLVGNPDCACFLVEAIAKRSQNVPWTVTVDGEKQSNSRIRRVSLDQFYSFVTGDETAFYQICMALPNVIKDVLSSSNALTIPEDTAYSDLKSFADNYNGEFGMALFMLGFGSYLGFRELGK